MQRPSNSAIKEYANVGLQTGVSAADPHGLVLLMYDGALEALARGKRHMEGGQITAKCADLAMATNIIAEGLKASLDLTVGGQIAQNLSDLYDYMTDRLLLANRENRPEILFEVTELLRGLRDAWKQIGKAKPQAAEQPPVQVAPATYKPGPASAKAQSAPAAIPAQASRAAPAGLQQTYGPAATGRSQAAGATPPGPPATPENAAPAAKPPQASKAAPASLKQTYGPAATGQSQAAGATPPGPPATPENAAPAVSSQSRRLAAAYGVR